jgi:hypothetical protein
MAKISHSMYLYFFPALFSVWNSRIQLS